jgi:hypothetical protein
MFIAILNTSVVDDTDSWYKSALVAFTHVLAARVLVDPRHKTRLLANSTALLVIRLCDVSK